MQRRSPFSQHNRIKTLCVERKHTDGSSGCVGQMTSCVGISLLSCRVLLSVVGGGGVVPSLSVLFFFASGGSSHGRTDFVLCLGRATSTSDRPLSLSLSAGTDTGSSRDVTLRRTSLRGVRGPALCRRSQFSLIIYETNLPSCQTSRRTGCLFSLVPAQ